ncbi:MAG TPA: hypothetical protein VEZ72_13100, partial [Paenibacillus sp.]|nr:hypothetical protein [Paenibacillus sp.]
MERAWIETADPRTALAAAGRVRLPVLNSLSADSGAWEKFGAATQSFDANAEATFELASRYGVPPERCIVDVCILPRRYVPDAPDWVPCSTYRGIP